jgi:hypothetical protein
MNRLLILLALTVGGCAQTPALDTSGPVSSTSTIASPAKKVAAFSPGDRGGTASVHVIWRCPVLGAWVPDAIKADFKVLVDGKAAGTVHMCQHTRVTVAAGTRAIRIGDPFIDFGAMWGTGDSFALPAGEQLYLLASPDGHGNVFVNEVSSARGQAEMAALDTH